MSKYKLILENFGKFKNTTFDLDEVTVVCGPNEVGKTTMIDGIVNAMANGRKNQPLYSHILKPRYGEGFSSKLKVNATGENIDKVDHDLAKDLLLIRASSFELNLSKGAWVNTVKDKLFTGGVNPQSLIDAISFMDGEKIIEKSHSPLYEVKKINKKISGLTQDLLSIQAETKLHASSMQQQEVLQVSEQDLEKKLIVLDSLYKTEKEKLELWRQAHEQMRIIKLHEVLSNKNKLEDKLNKLDSYKEETLSEIKTIQDNLQNLNNRKDIYKSELELKKTDLKTLRESQESAELGSLKFNYELAIKYQNILELQISNEQDVKYLLLPTIIGSMCLLMGVGMLVFLMEPYRYIGMAFILIGVIALKKRGLSSSSLNLQVEIKTFNQQYKADSKCPDTNFSDANDFLRSVIKSYTDEEAKGRQLKDKYKDLEKEITKLSETQESNRFEIIDILDRLQGILPQGISGHEQYFIKLNDKNLLKSEVLKLTIELEQAVLAEGVSNIEDLTSYVERKLIGINKHPTTVDQVSQSQIAQQETKIKELYLAKDKLSKQLSGVEVDLTRKSTEVQLKVGELSKSQVNLEKEIQQLNQTKEIKQLEMDSLNLLKDIVVDVAGDAADQFEILNEDINKYMKVILGNEREIKFENLKDSSGVTCLDHYGEEIQLDQLSSGTRDAFILSARLAFLEKVSPGDNTFLILDDPFVFMDKERRLRAIEALNIFYNKLNLPILLFTKDVQTKHEFCNVFSSAATISLEK
jgi:hypothetical protein